MKSYRFLTKERILQLHEEMVRRHGGALRIWDEGKLDAAVAAPRASFGGVRAHDTLCEIAAAYWYHISQAHPFESANKRTAAYACVTFLRLNGYVVTCTNEELAQIGYNIATGEMTEKELSCWLEGYVSPI